MDFYIVRIMTKLVETSSALNQFTLWRHNNRKDIGQTIVVFNNDYPDTLVIPPDLPCVFVNRSISILRATVRSILKENEKANLRTVFHVHNPRMALIFFFACAGLSCRKRTLFTVHTNIKTSNSRRKKFYTIFDSMLAGYTNCCSNSSYEGFYYFIKKIKGRHIRSIQNCVDIERVDRVLSGLDTAEHKPDNLLKLVFIGRASSQKNHLFLLDVINECPDCELLFIGPVYEPAAQKIKELGLDNRVRFTGMLPREKVYENLCSADVYVSASSREGLPISVLEAMCCSLPAILSDIPAHAEVAQSIPDIRILPIEKNIWVRALNDLQTGPKEVLKIQGLKNRENIERHFSIDNMHRQYDAVFSEMADRYYKVGKIRKNELIMDNDRILISVIIPVYNVEAYLERSVDSVLNQTYDNLEVILINDGSTDGSGGICDRYAQSDARVRVIHQENKGVSAARNAGMDIMRGQWVAFIDGDDYIHAQMFEKLLDLAAESDTLLVSCGLVKFFPDGREEFNSYPDAPRIFTCRQVLEYYLGAANEKLKVYSNRTKLFHRSITEDGGKIRFKEDCNQGEDELFTVQVMLKTDKMAYIPDPCYYVCWRGDSSTGSPVNEQTMTQFPMFLEMIAAVKHVSPALVRYVKLEHTERAIKLLKRVMKKGSAKDGHKFIPELRREAKRYMVNYLFFSKDGFSTKIKNKTLVYFPKLRVALSSEFAYLHMSNR